MKIGEAQKLYRAQRASLLELLIRSRHFRTLSDAPCHLHDLRHIITFFLHDITLLPYLSVLWAMFHVIFLFVMLFRSRYNRRKTAFLRHFPPFPAGHTPAAVCRPHPPTGICTSLFFLEKKMNITPDGKEIYANEAARLELTLDAVTQRFDENQEVLDRLVEERVRASRSPGSLPCA